MKKQIITLISFVMMTFVAVAQQDLLLSQQFFSRINKNPAGVGNVNDLDFFLLGRYQYIDIKDAPKSGVFNAQTFVDKLNSGFGFSFSYDNIGIARSTTNAKIAYAYNLKLNDDMILSLGVSAGVQYGYFNAAEYTLEDESEITDGDFPTEKETKLRPDFDFGVEFATPRFLLGVSITHLTNNEETSLVAGRHYYAYVRYMFPLSSTFELAPAFVYMHKSKTNVVELNLMAFYNRFIWGGLTYHPDVNDKFRTNPVGITAGIEYQSFRIGYTFDWAFGKVSRLSGNAHELMLSFTLPKRNSEPVYERFE